MGYKNSITNIHSIPLIPGKSVKKLGSFAIPAWFLGPVIIVAEAFRN